ncbi:MAG: hypothetical protein NC225_07760 [Clostridium sp.]|nr:hypothetical protein [Clostridium sp.]MCM1460601.1 hypothetical protein [Bacteroides sp.]
MDKYIDYQFKIGKRFRQQEAQTFDEYLRAAEDVSDYLEQFMVETEDGIYWKDQEPSTSNKTDKPDLTYFAGTGGIGYLYLQLYKVTKNEKYLTYATKAVDYLDSHWREQAEVAISNLNMSGIEYGIYMGVAGIGMVIAQYYKYAGRKKDLKVLEEIAYEIIHAAKQDETGIFWNGDTSMLFDGGVLVYLAKVNEYLQDETVTRAVCKAADCILAKAEKDARGGYAWLSTAHPNQTRVPNFECGTAGVGYALTVAYDVTGDQRYLNAAMEAAIHLKAIAIQQGDGFLVPWHDNPKEDTIFYVSSCHGPAGTSKLFYRLHQITGKKEYLEFIDGLYKGLRYLEVPEKQSAGYWNTTCLCCGTAGVLQFLINYSLVTGSDKAKEVAVTAGNILLGEQEKQNKGIAFPLAFERVNPGRITKSISYAVGTAGIAAALTQLYLFLENKYEWDRLFDDPYPENA